MRIQTKMTLQSKWTLVLALQAACCFLGVFASKPDSNPQAMMQSNLSRKVLERACAASRETIDEIIKCVLNSDTLIKTLGQKTSRNCYKDSFGVDFMDGDVDKHKELICNSRDKFESMTACIYKASSAKMDAKQMDKFTESLVDVGLCIMNALDG